MSAAASGSIAQSSGHAAATASDAPSDDEHQTLNSLVGKFEYEAPGGPNWEGSSGPFLEDLLAGQIKECKIVKGTTFQLSVSAEHYDNVQMSSLVDAVARNKLGLVDVTTTTSEDGCLWLALSFRAAGDGNWTAAWRAGALVISRIA